MKKAPLRQPQAGHAEPCIPYRRFRHGAGAAPFHGAGHIVRLPLGGVPFPRLPQRPYHERTVLRCHGIGFANFSGAAVYRFLHRRCKERLHKGVSPPNHRIAVYRGKAAACAASGGLALGIFIAYGFAALLFLPMEAYPKPGESVPNYFGNLMETALMFFASEAFWSLTGLTFAALTNSKYMAYAKKEKNDMRKTNDKAREGDISIGGMKKSL